MLIHGYCIQCTIKWWKKHSFQIIPISSAILSRRLGSFEDRDLPQSHSSRLQSAALRIHVIPCHSMSPWRITDPTRPNTRLLLVILCHIVSCCPRVHSMAFSSFSSSSPPSAIARRRASIAACLPPATGYGVSFIHFRYASGSSPNAIQSYHDESWWTS